jgi:hypothetical protein
MNPGTGYAAEDREQRVVLGARLESFEADYALGRISGAQLQKSTATVNAELAEIDARLTTALRRSSSSAILRANDPGAAFLAAPLDIQRAVIASVIDVEVLPHPGPRGTRWTSERLQITPST